MNHLKIFGILEIKASVKSMWASARKQEKKLNSFFIDHKQRAERRKKFYEERRVDPSLLLRVTGLSCSLIPNADLFNFHENEANLHIWPGDNDTRIDRFDVRGLMDFIPEIRPNDVNLDNEEFNIEEELMFERFRDLVDDKRLNRSEEIVLESINEDWNELLIQNNAKLSGKDKQQEKDRLKSGSAAIAFDYGTSNKDDSDSNDSYDELSHLKEEDLLDYVHDLSEKEIATLNEYAKEFGIKDHYLMLETAKSEIDSRMKILEDKKKV
ncbi:hypothetical protein HK096_000146 [Nowakowskiella sp. JEL0078]|nr:hypothetical protein HK096_000146 [Nowakowskiella sp. JEL0078]